MIEDGVKKYGYLAAARKSALMTQDQLADKIGCTTPVIVKLEKSPKTATVNQLVDIYNAVGNDGKAILEKFVSDIFLG